MSTLLAGSFMTPATMFSREYAITILARAVSQGLDLENRLYVALSPNMFFQMLLVSGINSIKDDPYTHRVGVDWLGAFWFIGKDVEGEGTSRANYYIEDFESKKRFIIPIDETAEIFL